MTGRLRLLKVVVQPVFVLDDGEHLLEQVAEPITVTAADWPNYPETLAAEILSLSEEPERSR